MAKQKLIKNYLALEEATGSNMEKETELTLYGFVDDIEDLFRHADASKEIEQCHAKLGKYQRCRCRHTKTADTETYVYTVKVPIKKSNQLSIKKEYNFEVDQSYFNFFQGIANTLERKTRFDFIVKDVPFKLELADNPSQTLDITVPSLLFEIDAFKLPWVKNENGDKTINELYSHWCKIDVELDEAMKYIEKNYPDATRPIWTVKLSMLPLTIKKAFIEKEASEEQKKLLDGLWGTEFVTTL